MASTEALAEGPLGEADLEGACALVAQAGWNQNAADWRIFLQLGTAIGLKSEGSLVATAATLPYASGFGWISMVLVSAAWRRRGIATRLLGECISRLTGAGMIPVLDATPAGREVYKPLGFRDGWPIQRWRRRSAMAVPKIEKVRPLRQEDWPGVLELDAVAFGCDRSPLLGRLRARSREFSCIAEGKGFLLGREGRVATQLGPIVAANAEVAGALAAHALAHVKAPVIVDTLERHAGFARWLEAHGFERERPYTRMALGRDELFGDPSRSFAIAGPELG